MLAHHCAFVNSFFKNFKNNFLVLVIQQAMAKTLEIRVGNLIPELLTDALIFLGTFQTARAITTGALETIFNHLYHFLVIVKSDSHTITSLPDSL